MSILSRLFTFKKSNVAQSDSAIIENPAIKNPLSLTILVDRTLSFDFNKLTRSLGKINSSMKKVKFQSLPCGKGEAFNALASWNQHLIKVVGFDTACSPEVVKQSIEFARDNQDLIQTIKNHNSHIIISYHGYEDDLIKQYLILTQFAIGFEHFNMVGLLNLKAQTILSTHVVSALVESDNGIELLCECLPLFFVGFKAMKVDIHTGICMRTYGAGQLGFPDFAVFAESFDETDKYLNIFNNLLLYLHQTHAEIAAGHTIEDDRGKIMLLREPSAEEGFLKDGSLVLVAQYRKV